MKQILLIGASGGIGNKTALDLLAQGYKVIGTYYQDKQNIKNLIENPNFTPHSLNIKDYPSLKELSNTINGDLYSVINCSGVCLFEGENEESDIQIWKDTLEINLLGNFYLAKIFYPKLENNGRFIMISSTDSFYGGDITSAYAASKAGVNSLTKSLSLLFKDKKINVNSIAPGWVRTSMIQDNGEEFLDKVAQINPLKRIALPQDISNLIKFLISEDSSYINGQVISIEGAYTNQDPTLLIEEETVLK
jgi:3-oxoacyl-[acyl-carrier protein] reductase